jgi:hypothetical protein
LRAGAPGANPLAVSHAPRALRRLSPALLLALAAACLAGAPDSPVAHDAADDPPGAAAPEPTLVSPRAGLVGLRPHAFEGATPIGDGTTLRVRFWGGVAPCFALGPAEVLERPDAVTVTLFAGSDPAQLDAVCIEIALWMATDVRLSAPLGGRPVRDGAAGPGGS